ncbi:PhiH1 repressor [Natronorubrum sp. DTA28]|uniref:PhiH1 repressor n=1 Tax=Natronorubrum sp. DTA28 TaxID=3447019 RepID=UPI003F838247
MTIWDDRILEIIREKGPKPVGKLTERDEIRICQSSVSRRCNKLAENGLLAPLGNGVYTITDRGKAYLDEEYDAENEVFLNGNSSRNGPNASQTSES